MSGDSQQPVLLRRDQALAYIIEHIVRHQSSPTLDEIGLALGGISKKRVSELIEQLIVLKSIEKTPGKQRNLRVCDVAACRQHLTEALRRLRWTPASPLGSLEPPPQGKLPRVPRLGQRPGNPGEASA
jgi:SOS-response transcriptional repressor LexA